MMIGLYGVRSHVLTLVTLLPGQLGLPFAWTDAGG